MKIKTLLIASLNVLPAFSIIQDCKDFGKFLQRSGFTYNSQEDCCDLINTEQYTFNITCSSSNILTIKIDGETAFPNYILPKRFFDLPKLKILSLYKTSKMPENEKDINGSSPVEEIYLDNTGLVKFPYILKKLKNLKTLSISGNQIQGNLTSEIKEFKSLKQLYIQNNKFEGELIIPDSLTKINIVGNKFTSYSQTNRNTALQEVIANGTPLINNYLINKLSVMNDMKRMYLSSGSITKLPNAMFNLTNMEALDISYNSNIKKAIIINFGYNNTKPLKECNFSGVTIQCYQNKTCEKEDEYLKNYRECTQEEIDSVRFNSGALSIIKSLRLNFAIVGLILMLFTLL